MRHSHKINDLRLAKVLDHCTVLASLMPPATPRHDVEVFAVKLWFEGYKAGVLAEKAAKQNTASTRRAERERNAPGWHSDAEFKLLVWLFQNRCAYCWEEADITEDHVIPLAHLGTNYIENILPACGRCNSKKGARV